MNITTNEGKVVGLTLPYGKVNYHGKSDYFRNGKFIGTVWYAENSHYVLEVIEEADAD